MNLWIPSIILVLLALLLHWLPVWRRQGLYFGVTVPSDFRNSVPGKQVLGRYRLLIWASALICVALTQAAVMLRREWLLPAGTLLLTAAASLAFALGRRRVQPFAEPLSAIRSASLSSRVETLPGGPAAVAFPFTVLAAAALYVRSNWDRIPERFPVHWGLSGVPDRWAQRAWQGAYGPILGGLLLTGLILLIGEGILRGSPRSRGANTGDWSLRFRRANLRLLMAVTWGCSLLLSYVAITPIIGAAGKFGWLPPVLLLASIVPFVWQLIQLSQEPGSGSDGTPDECWKFGQIYYNRADPALMVEKRFGIGYTLNFGNPASWWLVGLLAAVIVVITTL